MLEISKEGWPHSTDEINGMLSDMHSDVFKQILKTDADSLIKLAAAIELLRREKSVPAKEMKDRLWSIFKQAGGGRGEMLDLKKLINSAIEDAHEQYEERAGQKTKCSEQFADFSKPRLSDPVDSLREEKVFPIWGIVVSLSDRVSDDKRASIVEYFIDNNKSRQFGLLYPVYPIRERGLIYVLFPDVKEQDIHHNDYFDLKDKAKDLVMRLVCDVLADEDIINVNDVSESKIQDLCREYGTKLEQLPSRELLQQTLASVPKPVEKIETLTPYERIFALTRHVRAGGKLDPNLTHWFVEPQSSIKNGP